MIYLTKKSSKLWNPSFRNLFSNRLPSKVKCPKQLQLQSSYEQVDFLALPSSAPPPVMQTAKVLQGSLGYLLRSECWGRQNDRLVDFQSNPFTSEKNKFLIAGVGLVQLKKSYG